MKLNNNTVKRITLTDIFICSLERKVIYKFKYIGNVIECTIFSHSNFHCDFEIYNT